jgi:hypothetical protein
VSRGNNKGLNDNERGQMGVSRIQGIVGWTIGPPADNEYAVEPVGVDTINLLSSIKQS